MPIITFIYIILRSLYFFFFYHHYTISTDKIIVLPNNKVFNSKEEVYDFKEIEKITFIDKYWIFYKIQKIQILLLNGQEKIINCDGINGEDEWADSFDKQYEYTKKVFNNTCRKE